MRIARSSFLLAALLAACTPEAPEETRVKASLQPIVTIGNIDAIEGDAFHWHDAQRNPAQVGAELRAGDRLETGVHGKIKATLSDKSVVAIGAGTQLQVSDLTVDDKGRTGRVKVAAGRFWMQITKWTGKGTSHYDVETPNAVAGVRGTTLWGDSEVDAICALEGTIEVRSLVEPALTPAKLEPGKCASELSHGKLAPFAPTPEQIEGYLSEVLIR